MEKLKKFNQEEYVYYYGNEKVVELPEYVHNEKAVRGIWVSNVMNIDTPVMESVESYKE